MLSLARVGCANSPTVSVGFRHFVLPHASDAPGLPSLCLTPQHGRNEDSHFMLHTSEWHCPQDWADCTTRQRGIHKKKPREHQAGGQETLLSSHISWPLLNTTRSVSSGPEEQRGQGMTHVRLIFSTLWVELQLPPATSSKSEKRRGKGKEAGVHTVAAYGKPEAEEKPTMDIQPVINDELKEEPGRTTEYR